MAPPSFGMTWGGLPVNGGCSTTVAVATALTVGVARPAVAQQSVAHLGCSLGWA